ncbi:UNVERIFIED_CONTAM: hypothetical protein RMT77_001882 [Armadillidium vulgare]
MRGVMRFRGKFFFFITLCLVFVFYNTLLKLLYFPPTKTKAPPSSSFALPLEDEVSAVRDKCRDMNPKQCLQFLKVQAQIDVELQVENDADTQNTSHLPKMVKVERSYLIPSENFVIEHGTTPVSFHDVPKINPKIINQTRVETKNILVQNIPTLFHPPPLAKGISPEERQRRAAHFNSSAVKEFLSRQTERKASEEKYCSKELLDRKENQLSQSIFKNIIIDREFYLTYCPIYKAASTTWLANLLKLRGMWREDDQITKTQMLVNQFLQKVTNLGAPWMSKGTTRFIVVRHPFHRLISCYRDKYQNASKAYYYNLYGEKMVRLYRPRPKGATKDDIRLMLNDIRKSLNSYGTVPLPKNPYTDPVGPTFEEFVRYIVHARMEDDHWRPYYIQCGMCHMVYDFVLKFENINEDSKIFIEYLNFTNVINTGWKNPTAGGRTTDEVVCSYLHQIDSQLLKDLLIKYEHDFKLFNYSPEKFYKCVKDYNILVKSVQ